MRQVDEMETQTVEMPYMTVAPTSETTTEKTSESTGQATGEPTSDTSGGAEGELPTPTPPLRADSSLAAAVASYEEYMQRKGFRENTIKAFLNDLKIFVNYMDSEKRLLTISTDQLNEFLKWLQFERKNSEGKLIECKQKTLARRITTLKNFFGWLHGIGIIGSDPAQPIVQVSVRTPLPTILTDGELTKLLTAAQDCLFDRKNADARPYLLVHLLLQTGMKKAECARLTIDDIDVSNPQSPTVTIRYPDETQAHKNRSLSIHPGIVPALNQYLQAYKPENLLFPCTPRNLEYVLDDVGKRAEIKRVQVGFEILRWTAAVRDYRNGVSEEQLRTKMGLTKISWRETGDKIQQLTRNR